MGLTSFILKAVAEDKIIAAVCHGPGALVSAQMRHLLKKESVFNGKNITGFSNEEEKSVSVVVTTVL